MQGTPQLVSGSPPVAIVREQANPADTDGATAQTVRAMCRLIRRASSDPKLLQVAASLPSSAYAAMGCGGAQLASADPQVTAALAVWHFVKNFVRFEHDESILLRLLNERDQMECLTDPSVMIREVSPSGDCDCFTMLVCALLSCLSVPWEIVTLACSWRDPWRWSHVFPAAFPVRDLLMDRRGCQCRRCTGSRPAPVALALDASHGKYPGWAVPSEDVTRWATWNRHGVLTSSGQGAGARRIA
jgi:hypothetical protein